MTSLAFYGFVGDICVELHEPVVAGIRDESGTATKVKAVVIQWNVYFTLPICRFEKVCRADFDFRTVVGVS